jgi:Dyp-type peroxidase family
MRWTTPSSSRRSRRAQDTPTSVFDPDSDLVTGPVVEGAPDEPVLAVDEIQGNVVPGFGSFVQTLLGIRFEDADSARRWLTDVLPAVSTLRQVNDARNVRRRAARSREPRPASPVWTNLALSVEGLKLFGLPTDRIRDDAFRVGLYGPASRALGDPREPAHEGHVSRWVVGGSATTVPHVLAIVAADDAPSAAARVRTLKENVNVVYEERGEVLVDGPNDVGREHFGFRDGISTIAPRGRLSRRPRHFLSRRYVDPEDERALDYAKPGQPLVWPGQFVFGYPCQRDAEPASKPGPEADAGYPWMADGSFLVFRRLRQDVPEFRAFLAEESARMGGLDPDRLAAMLVGRWPNGTALAVDPDQPEEAPMADRLRVNHFGYANDAAPIRVCADPFVATEESRGPDELRQVPGAPADLSGDRCPTFAHVRKVNPRDSVTDQGGPAITLRSQMLRRGITFGPRFESPDDTERGLLFLAYQTSIEQQFELLSRKWMNRPNAPEPSSGHDLLVGQEHGTRTATLAAPGGGTVEISTERVWVVPTGGGYFFSPSISVLEAIASGTIDSSAHRSQFRARSEVLRSAT